MLNQPRLWKHSRQVLQFLLSYSCLRENLHEGFGSWVLRTTVVRETTTSPESLTLSLPTRA